jgi:ubiquitin C-terminal hydrolase
MDALDQTKGINNPGTKCYMISALQLLFSIIGFRILIFLVLSTNQQTFEELAYNKPFTVGLARIFSLLLYSNENSISLDSFEQIDNLPQQFKGKQHQDCEEFLSYLLENIHEETDLSHHKQQLQDLLYSQTFDSIRCDLCGDTRVQPHQLSPIINLSLPYQDQIDLSTVIRNNFSETRVEVECPKCPSKQSMKLTKFTQYPKHLILKLNRYMLDGSMYIKNLINVQFGSNELFFEDDDDEINIGRYLIVGIITHIGNSLNMGHYRIYKKFDEQMFRCMDDGRVDVFSFEQMTNQWYTEESNETPYIFLLEDYTQQQYAPDKFEIPHKLFAFVNEHDKRNLVDRLFF